MPKGRDTSKHPNRGVGRAMFEGISSITHATNDPSRFKEDSDGLIPSDHVVKALGDALERGGARRI